jgi:hypothetical protein
VLAASGQVNGRAVTVAAAGEEELDEPEVDTIAPLVGVVPTGRAEDWFNATGLLTISTLIVDATGIVLARVRDSVMVVNAVILLVSVDVARTRIR